MRRAVAGSSLPARTARQARAAVWCATAAAFVLFCVLFVPPILESSTGAGPSWLRLAFAPLCHQLPERSFVLFGGPLAVCARCTGLLLGGVLGLACAAWLVVGRERAVPRSWLAALVLPTAADGALAVLGASPLAELPRFLLAVPAGVAAGVLLAIGIYDLVWLITGDRVPVGCANPRRIVEESR